MREINISISKLTYRLLRGRATKNGRTVEEEATTELARLEAESLRKALIYHLTSNLQKVLAVLVESDDKFVPDSIFVEKTKLRSKRSVRAIFTHLNRSISKKGYLYWSDLLEYNEKNEYRLPAHLRDVVRDALSRNSQ